MRVSVLTPLYNEETAIEPFLKALNSQTVSPDEIIFYDDGSRDGTVAEVNRLAEADCRIRLITGSTNRGRGYARQALIDAVDTEYVAWLDVDDRWHPRQLEVQLQEYRYRELSESAPVLICSPYYRISVRRGGETVVDIARTYSLEDYLAFARQQNDAILLQTTFGAASTFKEVGFDSRLNWSEDFDFFLRFFALGGRVIPQRERNVATAYYHTIEGKATNDIIAAHDYLYAKNRHLWPRSSDALTEKYLRRLGYVLYACIVNREGAIAERVFYESVEYLGSSEYQNLVRAGVRAVLKSHAEDPRAYLRFAHSWANRGKRLKCIYGEEGYTLYSDKGVRVRWKVGLGEKSGCTLRHEDVLTHYLSGIREIAAVERVDAGRRRIFQIRALKSGFVGLVPSG